jgi:hypothetical protein
MCNGSSTRVSQGGSIAVLRSTLPVPRSNISDEMRLLFFNDTQALVGRAGTRVEFQGWEDVDNTGDQANCWVVIQ